MSMAESSSSTLRNGVSTCFLISLFVYERRARSSISVRIRQDRSTCEGENLAAAVLVDELFSLTTAIDLVRSYAPHPVIGTFSVTDAYGRAPLRLRRSRQ